MIIELNTLSYILLTTIFSAASIISIKNGKNPDVHPLVLNNQGEYPPLRYPGESAIIKSKVYLNGVPQLSTMDQSFNTLSKLYQVALNKYKNKQFLGDRNLTKKDVIWVNSICTVNAIIFSIQVCVCHSYCVIFK